MNILTHFKKITTFIFDVDGVLTDGTLLILENGLHARKMHIKDGLALQMAVKNGYRILIVSGSESEPVKERLEKLGVKDIRMSVMNKKNLVEEYLKQNHLSGDEVLYMGDDLPDISAMSLVELSCCPADAASEVKAGARYISPVNGGWGCVRDVIEKVLRLNDHWHNNNTIASR